MSAVPRLSDAALDEAAEAVRRRTGLVFPPARRAALVEGLKRAMARAHATDVSAYLARLGDDRLVLEDLATEITVAESYFFRAPEQIAVAVELVRAARMRERGPLRVWSAGCAGGEEPYTLAIALHRAGLAGRVHLLATDLSPRALERARRGRYGHWSLRGVDLDVVHAYFTSIRDEFELIPEIRNAVEFRCLNLVDDSYPSLASGAWGMDLILCRNVLIYFDAETATRVVRRLVDCLGPAGSLLLGASDPAIADRIPCEVVMTGAGLVYRRGRRSAPAGTSPEPAPRNGVAPDAHPPQPEPGPPPARAVPAAAEQPPASVESPAPGPGARSGAEEAVPAAAGCYADRDYAVAASLAQQDVQRNADALAPWIVLVRSLANLGRLAEAGRVCATALDRHRTSAELHYLHAVLLSESGRPKEAASAARRALYLDPGLVVAHLALATALARTGDLAGARRAVRNAERLLEALPPESSVQAGDGESAGRLLTMARAHLRLLGEAA